MALRDYERAPESSPTLATERLELRRVTEGDAPFILALLNEPAFLRFVGDRNVHTLEDAATYIRDRMLASYAAHGFGFEVMQLRGTDIPIGICGLVKREALEHPDIGFAMLAQFCGKGYAIEAARAVLAHAREALGLTQIVAITAAENHASGKLLEKLGLNFERMIQLPDFAAPSKLYVVRTSLPEAPRPRKLRE